MATAIDSPKTTTQGGGGGKPPNAEVSTGASPRRNEQEFHLDVARPGLACIFPDTRWDDALAILNKLNYPTNTLPKHLIRQTNDGGRILKVPPIAGLDKISAAIGIPVRVINSRTPIFNDAGSIENYTTGTILVFYPNGTVSD